MKFITRFMLYFIGLICALSPVSAQTNQSAMTVFPSSIKNLRISCSGATATITRSNKFKDIKIQSNCPAHWDIHDGFAQQSNISSPKNGFLVEIVDRKGYVVFNSTGYELPKDKVGLLLNIPNDKEHQLKIINNKLNIEGESITPLSIKTKFIQPAEDLLDITIPDSYSGDLKVRANMGSHVILKSWKFGNVAIELNINSVLRAGGLEDISSASIYTGLKSNALVEKLICKNLFLSADETCSIKIESGSAASTKFGRSQGNISLYGKLETPKDFRPGKNGPKLSGETVDNGSAKYLAELLRRITPFWNPPKGEENKRIEVSFLVDSDGKMSDLKIVSSNGSPEANEAARKAVMNALPFKPLPIGLKEPVPVHFFFDKEGK